MGQIVFTYPGRGQHLKLTGSTAALTFDGRTPVTYPLTIREETVVSAPAGSATLSWADVDGNTWSTQVLVPAFRDLVLDPHAAGVASTAGAAAIATQHASDILTYGRLAPDYVDGRNYVVGELVTYSGTLYRITTAYTSSGGTLNLGNATAIGGGGGGSADKLGLTPTAVKTANYTAAAGEFVPVDTTSGAVTVTLPTAPADGTVLAVKHVIQGGANVVTVALGGSDVFNKASGATSMTLPLLAQGVVLQYKSSTAIWYLIANDMPLGSLDLRFPPIAASPSAAVSSKTTSFTAAGGNTYLVDASGGAVTATCAAGAAGDTFRVINVGATGTVTIAPPSGSPGGANITLTSQYQASTVLCTATGTWVGGV